MEHILLPQQRVDHDLPKNLTSDDESDFMPYSGYTTAPVKLKKLTNAMVSPDSVIYKNGFLVAETVAMGGFENYYRYRHLFKKYFFSKSIKLDVSKKYLLLTDLYSSGHFHWVCEVLPKLMLLKEESSHYILLLPDNSYLRSIGIQSIEWLGLKFEDIVFMSKDNFYKARQLYYIPSISKTGLNKILLGQLNSRFLKSQNGSGKKLYISRAKANFRKVLNEKDLVKILSGYGFDIVEAEDLSFEQQYQLFSSASLLAGIHGAGLSNCIFMPANAKVLELRKRENATTNVAYWHLASSIGQKYYYFNGTPDSDAPLVGRGCNLSIDLKCFEERIEGILC